jgi:hypothetical protein
MLSVPTLHILGIRHHGPGSARSVLRALDELKPDCLLIEGPPDADDLIPHAAKQDMAPPVAILIYDAANPAAAVYYPFARFSPEWQAMRWALANGVPVRFMDLPQWHRLAIHAGAERSAAPASSTDGEPEEGRGGIALCPGVERDPLQRLATAAGFDDGERWWEHVVEHRHAGGGGAELFAAIRDAMAELRQSSQSSVDPDEPLREAHMRRTIREAQKAGHANIAVVCGAWHAPALGVAAMPKKDDDDLLKSLPKLKTSATWVPWTYDHLTFASGYGAGVRSPGWYEHLWDCREHVVPSWMARVARLLRGRDVDCSSAHVIEAVRLSETLATLRGRPLADLSDIADATRSVFSFDSDVVMRLIERDLLVGDRLGEVPADTPMVPLQQDLLAQQKSLRLKPETLEKTVDLDLRNETDRGRSVLLHRLRMLGIDWGTPAHAGGSAKGTFHEIWRLRWDPGFIVKLIGAGALGNTIEAASAAALARAARETSNLRQLAEMVQDAMLANLGDAAVALVRQIENVAALATDVALLMQTLPPLTNLVRYGNVRQTDEALVRHLVDGIVPRITAGLGGAVSSLNDEAAAMMEGHLRSTHAAVEQLDASQHTGDWLDALARILEHDTVHGLVRGRCARLLLDANRIDTPAVAQRLGQTLSRGTDPAHGARWLEGFLSGSGLLLIHDVKLLGLIDAWVADIAPDVFEELLPLLRRTFSTFPPPERRQIGQLLAAGTGGSGIVKRADGDEAINHERAERALPLLVTILK